MTKNTFFRPWLLKSLSDSLFLIVLLIGLVGFHVFHRILVPLIALSGLLVLAQNNKQFALHRVGTLASLLLFLTLWAAQWLGWFGDWPLDLFIASVAVFVPIYLMYRIPALARWNFRFTRNEWISATAILIPSLICLVWYYREFPEVAAQFPLPEISNQLLPIAEIVAAALNGLREEVLYRFVLQTELRQSLSVPSALIAQALAFGFLHFQNGFPNGWVGVAMTSFFGLAMGIQFYLFRSLTLCWMTHSLADAIMFSIIAASR